MKYLFEIVSNSKLLQLNLFCMLRQKKIKIIELYYITTLLYYTTIYDIKEM